MNRLYQFILKNSQGTSGMGKCLVLTGPNKLWMCISLLRNPGNLTSVFGRHLEWQQGTQLHPVHGLVQIAGKKEFDPFSQCTFPYPNFTHLRVAQVRE